jgi:rSAM/selenodomain-associated transferase 1
VAIDTSICVFFKPPRAGEVKTRLVPAVGAQGAAALAEAFFRDTWDCVESLRWAVPIVATTDSSSPQVRPRIETEVWLQGGGDLGARIERILRRALDQRPFAMAVGADSPGIPLPFLERAHQALQSADAVIGPCDDGGFYLLGVRECRPGLLDGIPWSQSITFSSTLKRLRDSGMDVAVIDSWYDIDRPEDLERLERQLAAKSVVAPETLKALRSLPMANGTHSIVSVEFDARKVNV